MMIGFYSKNLQIQELFSFLIKRGTIFLIALYLQIFSPAELQAPNATVSQIIAKDKGGASLSDVGLLHNEHAHTRQEDKAVRGQKLGTLRSKHARACLQSRQIDCVPTIIILVFTLRNIFNNISYSNSLFSKDDFTYMIQWESTIVFLFFKKQY